jgi:hypothetical protein
MVLARRNIVDTVCYKLCGGDINIEMRGQQINRGDNIHPRRSTARCMCGEIPPRDLIPTHSSDRLFTCDH